MICVKEQKVQGRGEVSLKCSLFFNVEETGFIVGSFLFLKVIIISHHHEYWLGF